MSKIKSHVCYYCGGLGDPDGLRPYGPDQNLICHECAHQTPERMEQTDKEMKKRINQLGGDYIQVIVTPTGFKAVHEA